MWEFCSTKIKFQVKFIWWLFCLGKFHSNATHTHTHRTIFRWLWWKNFMQNNNTISIVKLMVYFFFLRHHLEGCFLFDEHISRHHAIVLKLDSLSLSLSFTEPCLVSFYWYLCTVYADINVWTSDFDSDIWQRWLLYNRDSLMASQFNKIDPIFSCFSLNIRESRTCILNKQFANVTEANQRRNFSEDLSTKCPAKYGCGIKMSILREKKNYDMLFALEIWELKIQFDLK